MTKVRGGGCRPGPAPGEPPFVAWPAQGREERKRSMGHVGAPRLDYRVATVIVAIIAVVVAAMGPVAAAPAPALAEQEVHEPAVASLVRGFAARGGYRASRW